MIVVKPGNPNNIQTVTDLANVGIVSLCGDTVPCGKFAQQVLDNAGVSIPEDRITRGQNAKATITAVSEGDADAGIVYVTDVQACRRERDGCRRFLPRPNAVAPYPMAVLDATRSTSRWPTPSWPTSPGPEGQAVLREAGFAAP